MGMICTQDEGYSCSSQISNLSLYLSVSAASGLCSPRQPQLHPHRFVWTRIGGGKRRLGAIRELFVGPEDVLV